MVFVRKPQAPGIFHPGFPGLTPKQGVGANVIRFATTGGGYSPLKGYGSSGSSIYLLRAQ